MYSKTNLLHFLYLNATATKTTPDFTEAKKHINERTLFHNAALRKWFLKTVQHSACGTLTVNIVRTQPKPKRQIWFKAGHDQRNYITHTHTLSLSLYIYIYIYSPKLLRTWRSHFGSSCFGSSRKHQSSPMADRRVRPRTNASARPAPAPAGRGRGRGATISPVPPRPVAPPAIPAPVRPAAPPGPVNPLGGYNPGAPIFGGVAGAAAPAAPAAAPPGAPPAVRPPQIYVPPGPPPKAPHNPLGGQTRPKAKAYGANNVPKAKYLPAAAKAAAHGKAAAVDGLRTSNLSGGTDGPGLLDPTAAFTASDKRPSAPAELFHPADSIQQFSYQNYILQMAMQVDVSQFGLVLSQFANTAEDPLYVYTVLILTTMGAATSQHFKLGVTNGHLAAPTGEAAGWNLLGLPGATVEDQRMKAIELGAYILLTLCYGAGKPQSSFGNQTHMRYLTQATGIASPNLSRDTKARLDMLSQNIQLLPLACWLGSCLGEHPQNIPGGDIIVAHHIGDEPMAYPPVSNIPLELSNRVSSFMAGVYRRDVTYFLTFKDAFLEAQSLRYLRLSSPQADLLMAVYASIADGALVKSWRIQDTFGVEILEPELDQIFGFEVEGSAPGLMRALAQTVADLSTVPQCPHCRAVSQHALVIDLKPDKAMLKEHGLEQLPLPKDVLDAMVENHGLWSKG